MLGISYGELFLIIGATAALIGPKDLPFIAKAAGRLAGRAVGYVQMARGQFESVMQQSQVNQLFLISHSTKTGKCTWMCNVFVDVRTVFLPEYKIRKRFWNTRKFSSNLLNISSIFRGGVLLRTSSYLYTQRARNISITAAVGAICTYAHKDSLHLLRIHLFTNLSSLFSVVQEFSCVLFEFKQVQVRSQVSPEISAASRRLPHLGEKTTRVWAFPPRAIKRVHGRCPETPRPWSSFPPRAIKRVHGVFDGTCLKGSLLSPRSRVLIDNLVSS
ncbi:hypothetical protein IEQ34_009100 [Dendrobium chrysotoxum]|uniref:Uncharacterized protein n=1 Tax=Dendrobium chrysotoxum TaxID=161865 RepID=A0AAV7H205_DENCH|nr:hypothetical protein IEQ34_009100 [Dendrobium chrysotoxum]